MSTKMVKALAWLTVGWIILLFSFRLMLPSLLIYFIIFTISVVIVVVCVNIYEKTSNSLNNFGDRFGHISTFSFANEHATESYEISPDPLPEISAKSPDYEPPPSYQQAILQAINVPVDENFSTNHSNESLI